MRITIVGGGNIGTQFAVHCAREGHSVTMFTSRLERFSKTLSCVDAEGKVTRRAPSGVPLLTRWKPLPLRM